MERGKEGGREKGRKERREGGRETTKAIALIHFINHFKSFKIMLIKMI
jgi:hypothetical protein